MKIKIFTYEDNGKISADSYVEGEEITQNYSDAECQEYDILESTIESATSEILSDYVNFKMTLLQNIDVLDSAVELLHCIVKDKTTASERLDFLEQVNKVARKEAVEYFTGELVSKILSESGQTKF